jgi:metal-responsive CopG/Arc/MetJ family transcriptional regulator
MVNLQKGFIMTKKMTITLEDSLIEELNTLSAETGKKKTQVIREALQDYFDVNAITKTVQDYKMGTLKTISHNDMRASLDNISIYSNNIINIFHNTI